ncbi:hypothetical protein VT06_04635 [Arsukibacterium sp. MJ3]|nr:hypothetical protein VT06_04635 [Arsukibacterium sp. MJ3]
MVSDTPMKTFFTPRAIMAAILFTIWYCPTAVASTTDVKQQLLDGYLERCVEVLNSKGYSPGAIKAECKCELDQIDQQFAIFETMLAAGAVSADTQQQINDFKKQLLQCKVVPHPS